MSRSLWQRWTGCLRQQQQQEEEAMRLALMRQQVI
jgi:hypothetical protein